MSKMNIFNTYQQSKAHRHYVVEFLAFPPFIAMMSSGLVMLKFHTSGLDNLLVWGFSKSQWLGYHKISSGISLCFVVWHIYQHSDWINKLFNFTLKNKFKGLNTTLFIVFFLTVITSYLSWLLFEKQPFGEGLRGIHSKLGFLTIILFGFHIKNYFFWIKKMTLKIFSNQ